MSPIHNGVHIAASVGDEVWIVEDGAVAGAEQNDQSQQAVAIEIDFWNDQFGSDRFEDLREKP